MTNTNHWTPPPMTTGDIARMLEVSIHRVHKWAQDGHLQGWKTAGGHWRFDPATVQSFRPAELEDVLTTREVAAIFGASQETVLRWTRSGHLDRVPTSGRSYRYTRASVLALARECGITEAIMSYRDLPYDPDEPRDPDDEPLTEQELRLDEIQERGLKERQKDQERAGRRFDLLDGESEWGP